MIVCESGTGSGAMSHAILRTIAPKGVLHTYEFNQSRVLEARKEFCKNGVDHSVRVHWRDVCGKKDNEMKSIDNLNEISRDINADNIKPVPLDQKKGKFEEEMGNGGFNIGQAVAHAIFLDLPEPWLAIPHAAYTIKPNGRICSYSPCVEQSQKTIEALKSFGFHSIKTIEVRLREHHVGNVTMECVPTEKLCREPNLNPYVPGGSSGHEGNTHNETGAIIHPPENKGEKLHTNSEFGIKNNPASKDTNKEQPSNESRMDQEKGLNVNDITNSKNDGNFCKKRKLLCARPFASMRGHTAFLTFATSGQR